MLDLLEEVDKRVGTVNVLLLGDYGGDLFTQLKEFYDHMNRTLTDQDKLMGLMHKRIKKLDDLLQMSWNTDLNPPAPGKKEDAGSEKDNSGRFIFKKITTIIHRVQ